MRINPVDLLSPDRLDIVPRVRMARAIAAGANTSDYSDYFSRQYLSYFAHLAGGNKIYDESGTYTLKDRLTSFVETLNSIRSQGFLEQISRVAVLPSNPLFVLNGAHRIAACIALGQEVETGLERISTDSPEDRQTSDLPPSQNDDTKKHGSVNAGYHRSIGFSEDFVRDLVLDYSRITKRPRFIVLFDEAEALGDEVEQKLANEAQILDRIDLNLTQDGLFRFIHMAYQLQDWWAPSYVEDIARTKTGSKKSQYRSSIYTYEPRRGGVDAHSIKLAVRAHLESIGKNGRLIHGSDDWEDTEHILDLILSKPGRHFLNTSPYMADASLIEKLITYPKTSILDDPQNDLVIVGSSILELYGLRRAGDIDYISRQDQPQDYKWDNRAGSYLRSPLISLDEALFDPRFQFRLLGIKFQSLAGYRIMQEERILTKKGRDDFRLASSHLEDEAKSFSQWFSASLRKLRWGITVTSWRWFGKLAGSLPEFLKKPLRPIWDHIRKG